MFAAVDPTRPWPPTAMTTARWLHLTPRPVPLGDLIATQDGVYLAPSSGGGRRRTAVTRCRTSSSGVAAPTWRTGTTGRCGRR